MGTLFGKQCIEGPRCHPLLVGEYPNPPEQPTSGLAARSVPERFTASPLKRKLPLPLTAKGKIKNRRAVHMAKNKKAPENAPLKDALPGKFYLSFCSCDFLFICSFFS